MIKLDRLIKLCICALIVGTTLITAGCSRASDISTETEYEPMSDAITQSLYSADFDFEESMAFDELFDADMHISFEDTIPGSSSVEIQHGISEAEPQEPQLQVETADATNQAMHDPMRLGVGMLERMIIRTAEMEIYTLDYHDTVSAIEFLVVARGGFIESSRQWMDTCQFSGMLFWRATYAIRVPVGRFDTVNNALMNLGHVHHFSTTSIDATREFNDMGSRLQIRQAEEVRVARMLEEATHLVDIINLEARLTGIRLVIDAYQRRREEIDQLASFSTINLSVLEVLTLPDIEEEEEEEEEEEVEYLLVYTFGDRIGRAFQSSVNFTVWALEGIGVFLAMIILPLGLIGGIFVLIFIVVKKMMRTRKRS